VPAAGINTDRLNVSLHNVLALSQCQGKLEHASPTMHEPRLTAGIGRDLN